MNHQYLKEEKLFLNSFKNATLDLSKFHHKEHIKVTYILLVDNNIDTTYKCIKSAILNILKTVGVDTSKYHETMTYGWILIINYFMNHTKKCHSFEEFISNNSQLLDTDILYKHYSKKLIESEKARIKILNPDVRDFIN